MTRNTCAKALGACIAGLAAIASAQASVDDLLKTACGTGNPWRLAVQPGMSTSEIAVKLDGTAGRMVQVCNCTDDVAGKNTGIWVRSSMSQETVAFMTKKFGAPKKTKAVEPGPGEWPYYLPNKSCMTAGPVTVILAPVDDSVVSWGSWQLEAK